MKNINIIDQDKLISMYDLDCQRIVKIFEKKDYYITKKQAHRLWELHSNKLCAGWLMLPKNDEEIYDRLKPFFSEKFEPPPYVKFKYENGSTSCSMRLRSRDIYYYNENENENDLEYFRDAGVWSIGFTVDHKNKKIFAKKICENTKHLDGKELVPITKEEWEKDNNFGYPLNKEK